jgi:hypothetical protein
MPMSPLLLMHEWCDVGTQAEKAFALVFGGKAFVRRKRRRKESTTKVPNDL